MSSKRCSNCGHVIPSDSAYCVECGALQARAGPTPSGVSKRPPTKIRGVYIVIMFVSLALGASLGYFYGTMIVPPSARTVTQTATVTTTTAKTVSVTTTQIPTFGSEEVTGMLFVNTRKGVYRLNMKTSVEPQWELFLNETVRAGPSLESRSLSLAISPDGRSVAYNVPESGIYVMDTITGESRILLKHARPTQISCLSWNPDGSRISYRSCQAGTDPGSCQAETGLYAEGNYVLELSGKRHLIDKPRPPQKYRELATDKIVKATGELGCAVWAGTSTLLYQRFTGPWPKYLFGNWVGADTSTVATLTPTGVRLRNLSEQWAVDSASSDAVLLFDEKYGVPFLVRSSDLGTGKLPTRLEFCVEYNATARYQYKNKCRAQHFSPDGKQIAFLEYNKSANETNIILIDVVAPQTHTTIPLGVRRLTNFAWSPNGREIALQHTDMITIIDLQTQKEKKIIASLPWQARRHAGEPEPYLMRRTVWSSDGNYLAVHAVPDEHAPWEIAHQMRELVWIVRVSDNAYYPLPPLPEDISRILEPIPVLHWTV